MKIDIALAEVMARYDIRTHGNKGKIADYLECDRGTVRRLMQNETQQVSLERLGKLCEWLLTAVEAGRRADLMEELPGSLFKAAGLWATLRNAAKITTVIAEKILVAEGAGTRHAPLRKWLSSNDVRAAREIEHQLSSDRAKGPLDSYFVPFYFPEDPGQNTISDAKQKEAIAEARKRMDKLREEEGAILIVGSQRVNLVTELLVANYFGCTAFQEDTKRRVPFFIRYRNEDPTVVESCFGGHVDRPIGLHYRPGKGKKWHHLECTDGKHAAGVVLVHTRPNHTEVVLFGFSGGCTLKLGELFRARPGSFWPGKGAELASFVCQIPLEGADPLEIERGPLIIPLKR